MVKPLPQYGAHGPVFLYDPFILFLSRSSQFQNVDVLRARWTGNVRVHICSFLPRGPYVSSRSGPSKPEGKHLVWSSPLMSFLFLGRGCPRGAPSFLRCLLTHLSCSSVSIGLALSSAAPPQPPGFFFRLAALRQRPPLSRRASGPYGSCPPLEAG